MPPNQTTQDETREWLENAAHDFFAALWLMSSPADVSRNVCVQLQQAVEKVEKAFLTWHEIAFRPVHDLGELGKQCVQIEANLETILAPTIVLTKFAGKGKYVAWAGGVSSEEVKSHLKVVETAIDAILALLPEEVSEIYTQYLSQSKHYLK